MLLSHKDIYQFETQRAGLVHMPTKEISGCPTMMCLISEGRYVPCNFWVFCSGIIMGCDSALLVFWRKVHDKIMGCDSALLVFWRRVHDKIICLWTLNTCKRWQHIPFKCVEPRTHCCSITSQVAKPLKLLFHCTKAVLIDWIPFGLFNHFVRIISRPCSIVGVVTDDLERVWKVKVWSRYCLHTWLRKPTKTCQDSLYRGQNSNQEHPRHKCTVSA
jgi:hypothetical protein